MLDVIIELVLQLITAIAIPYLAILMRRTINQGGSICDPQQVRIMSADNNIEELIQRIVDERLSVKLSDIELELPPSFRELVDSKLSRSEAIDIIDSTVERYLKQLEAKILELVKDESAQETKQVSMSESDANRRSERTPGGVRIKSKQYHE